MYMYIHVQMYITFIHTQMHIHVHIHTHIHIHVYCIVNVHCMNLYTHFNYVDSYSVFQNGSIFVPLMQKNFQRQHFELEYILSFGYGQYG